MFVLRSALLSSIIFFATFLAAAPKVNLATLVARSINEHPQNRLFDQELMAAAAMQSGEISLSNPMLSYEEMQSTGLSSMKETKWELRQKFTFPLKTYFTFELYQNEIESVREQKRLAETTRLSQLNLEFARWLALHRKLGLKREQEGLLSQLISVQRTRYVSQKVSQVEIVALQIERGNLLNEISSMESELSAQRSKVETLVGPGESLQEFEPKDEKFDSFEPPARGSDAVAKALEERNSEIRSIKAMTLKSDADLNRNYAGWLPDLELMISEKDDHAGTKSHGWQLGVEIPLWLGAEQRAKVKQAKAAAMGARIQYEEQLRQKTLETLALIAELEQLKKQMGLMENGLVQWSGQNVQSARTAYQTGKIEYASFLALMQSGFETLEKYEDLRVKVIENQERLKLSFGGK